MEINNIQHSNYNNIDVKIVHDSILSNNNTLNNFPLEKTLDTADVTMNNMLTLDASFILLSAGNKISLPLLVESLPIAKVTHRLVMALYIY